MELDTAITYTLPIGAERVLVGRCKDCKFWYRSGEVLGKCDKIGLSVNSEAFTNDGTSLSTTETFGCIHFSEKD